MTTAAPGERSGVHLEAGVSGGGSAFLAGRDQHVHLGGGARRVTRAGGGDDTDVCPYPGLAAFGPEQAQWFFGRDRAVAEVCQRLDARLTEGGLLAITGPSGAGKSSLARAGVMAALDQGRLPAPGSRHWPRARLTPGARPVHALAGQLGAITGGTVADLAAGWLADSRSCPDAVRRALPGSGSRVVVLVDQFEEVFTQCAAEEERRCFIDLLARLAAGCEAPGLVMICVRADFYEQCLRYAPLRAALRAGPVILEPMSPAELRQVITCPALQAGLDIEPGLTEMLLRDAGVSRGEDAAESERHAGRLPLLAHALRATWQQRHGHVLTVDAYQATGGIQDAIATTAEAACAQLDDGAERVMRAMFLRLVKIGDGTDDTCRRVSPDSLSRDLPPQAASQVLEAFTKARLLTAERDTISITHEALLRGWPRLRQWIDLDRAGNLIRQDLEDAAAAWDLSRREPSALYRGGRLKAARAWAADQDLDLTETARQFLAASRRLQRRASLLRPGIAVLAALAVAASGATATTLQQRAATLRQRNHLIYNQVLAAAVRLGPADPGLAAQLDLAAYRMQPGPYVTSSLIGTENAALPGLVPGSAPGAPLAISPDGRTLAGGASPPASGLQPEVRLWDIAGPGRARRLGAPLPGTDAYGSVLAFSPDGRTLATTSGTGTIMLWDVSDPARRQPTIRASGAGGAVFAAAFSGNGRLLATSSERGPIRLWNLTSPARPSRLGPPLPGSGGGSYALAISPDSRTLAAISEPAVSGPPEWTIRLWDLTDPARPRALGTLLRGDEGVLSMVAFSPDSRTLAVPDQQDDAVRLWDLAEPARPRHLASIETPPNPVESVAFSRDGRALAVDSGAATQLWDLTSPDDPRPLGGPLATGSGGPGSAAFSLDGRTLWTSQVDGIRDWNLPPAMVPDVAPRGITMAFSADSRVMASGGQDGVIRLWAMSRPAAPRPLGIPLACACAAVSSLAFSRDGSMLASGARDGTVRLWDITRLGSPRLLSEPAPRGSAPVLSVAFSRDGDMLASGGQDGIVRLWDIASPGSPAAARPAPAAASRSVNAVAFAADGRELASYGAGTSGTDQVRLWTVTRAKLSQAPRLRLAYSADATGPGGILLTDAGSAAGYLKATRGRRLRTLRTVLLAGSPGLSLAPVTPASGDPLLAAAGPGWSVQLWDIADPARPRPAGRLQAGIPHDVLAIAASPDGRMLADATDDNHVIHTWDLAASNAIRRICATTASDLTPRNWRAYIPQLPYRPPCMR